VVIVSGARVQRAVVLTKVAAMFARDSIRNELCYQRPERNSALKNSGVNRPNRSSVARSDLCARRARNGQQLFAKLDSQSGQTRALRLEFAVATKFKLTSVH